MFERVKLAVPFWIILLFTHFSGLWEVPIGVHDQFGNSFGSHSSHWSTKKRSASRHLHASFSNGTGWAAPVMFGGLWTPFTSSLHLYTVNHRIQMNSATAISQGFSVAEWQAEFFFPYLYHPEFFYTMGIHGAFSISKNLGSLAAPILLTGLEMPPNENPADWMWGPLLSPWPGSCGFYGIPERAILGWGLMMRGSLIYYIRYKIIYT